MSSNISQRIEADSNTFKRKKLSSKNCPIPCGSIQSHCDTKPSSSKSNSSMHAATLADDSHSDDKPNLLQTILVPCNGKFAADQTEFDTKTCENHSPKAEDLLDKAIAAMTFAEGLPFALSDSHCLKVVLKHAKGSRLSHIPPTCNCLSTNLLDASCESHIAATKKRLLHESQVFGLCLSSDGATCKKKPLINYIFSGVHEQHFVAGTKDCSESLAKGIDKTGEFICHELLPLMDEVDVNKRLFDVAFF